MKEHERNCVCYDCAFRSRRQGTGLPSTTRPIHGPFSKAIHDAMPVKRGVRPCPFCRESTLMPEDVGGRNCLFPLSQLKSGQYFCPTHLFAYEWTDHFIEGHYHGITGVEALYRAMWKTYMEAHPDEASCPVPGLELSVQYHTPPVISPPGKIQSVVEHMQIAVGFIETLHTKSCFQRCCAVCGMTVEGKQSRPGTAPAGRAGVTSVISGQWGAPVDWRAHMLKHHVHRILLASAKALHTVSSTQQPVKEHLSATYSNSAREARRTREAMRRSGGFNRPTTITATGTGSPTDSKDPATYRYFTSPSTLLPGSANESLVKAATGPTQEDGSMGHQVLRENCWRWRGSVGPDPQPTRQTPRFRCPLASCKPDYLVTGKVRPESFYATCRTYDITKKPEQTPPPYCTATFTEREVLIQHLVRYHGIHLVHTVDEGDPSAAGNNHKQGAANDKHGNAGEGEARGNTPNRPAAASSAGGAQPARAESPARVTPSTRVQVAATAVTGSKGAVDEYDDDGFESDGGKGKKAVGGAVGGAAAVKPAGRVSEAGLGKGEGNAAGKVGGDAKSSEKVVAEPGLGSGKDEGKVAERYVDKEEVKGSAGNKVVEGPSGGEVSKVEVSSSKVVAGGSATAGTSATATAAAGAAEGDKKAGGALASALGKT